MDIGAFNCQDVSYLGNDVFVATPIPKPHLHMVRLLQTRALQLDAQQKISFLDRAHLQRDEG